MKETAEKLDGIHIWLVLWKATRAVEAHAHRHIAQFGIGPSDFGVLEALLHRGPLSATELGAKVLLTSGSMTTAIDRLEKRGLVVRRGDKADRRACVVHLTSTGKSLIVKMFAEHREAMEVAVSGISRKERAVLLPILRQLGKTAETTVAPRSAGRSRS